MPVTSSIPISHAPCEQRPARLLLERAGLRSSLARLKVLDALHVRGSGTALELHACLQDPANSISLHCIAQALRRLQQSGLLKRDADKRYSLSPAAMAGTAGRTGERTRH